MKIDAKTAKRIEVLFGVEFKNDYQVTNGDIDFLLRKIVSVSESNIKLIEKNERLKLQLKESRELSDYYRTRNY